MIDAGGFTKSLLTGCVRRFNLIGAGAYGHPQHFQRKRRHQLVSDQLKSWDRPDDCIIVTNAHASQAATDLFQNFNVVLNPNVLIEKLLGVVPLHHQPRFHLVKFFIAIVVGR